ncbi:MAG: hypothetical protein NZ700_07275 [Gemmataceae bacterium]|nr:hypothetical protein [Gemmataceae bacterium]MDW8266741.1 hypothetical protein [Gemmataceae bacterium]
MDQLLSDLPIKAVITVITAILSFVTYNACRLYWLRLVRRRLIRQAAEYARRHGNRVEVALVASVGTDIEETVKNYLRATGCDNIPLLKVHREDPFPRDEAAWISYLDQFKDEVRKARELAATRVYMFTNVPIAMALLLGAVLRNGPEALIHHYDNRGYFPIGPMVTETVVL